MKSKAISPIIASILLIIVSVILVVIFLTWGKEFTSTGMNISDTVLKETNKNYLIGSSKLNSKGILTFKNITPDEKSITITGYQIVSSSEDEVFNRIIDLNETTILPGAIQVISIPAFPPEQIITILLITNENEYISIKGIRNISEDLQNIPEQNILESEQLIVTIYSPNDNISVPLYTASIYEDFNATITGGTGEYTCFWEFKVYDICDNLVNTTYEYNCSFNKQLIPECHSFEVTLTVNSGEQVVSDTINYKTKLSSGLRCSPCPFI